MALSAEEPEAGPWSAVAAEQLAKFLLDGAEQVCGRPWIIAIDGRGAAGKSTLAERLLAQVQPAALVHTDDLAWHEPLFGWGHLLADRVLAPLHRGEAVSFQPPAWRAHGRDGTVNVPANLRCVVVEGTGANQRAFAHLIDRTIWIQADHGLAEERGIARDIEQGVNGDPEQTRQFWHDWMAHELAFFERERTWERADVVVAGTQVIALAVGEVAWAEAAGDAGRLDEVDAGA